MLRTLRAFAWMRWRVLLNSFERTGARDTLERLSIAVEQIGPLVALALLVPSVAGLAGLSVYAGYALATSSAPPFTFQIIRLLALAGCGFALIGPLVMPAMERTNAVRLLLLPIGRGVLYLAQASSALADPWVILLVPVALCLPLGLAAGGAPVGAALALAAGCCLVLILIGLTTVSVNLVYLLFRDRRRAEIAALLFIIVMPLLGMLPGLLGGGPRRAPAPAPGSGAGPALAARAAAAATVVFHVLPSEQYAAAVRRAAGPGAVSALGPAATLAGTALALHGLALFLFGRLLASPASTGGRRSSKSTTHWGRRLPGVSPAVSAVALAQLRTAVRTPRGRSVLLSPLIVFAVLTVLVLRGGESPQFGPFALQAGLGLATFGSFICLMAILPLAMNQFAIDGAGLTLEFLSPLDDRDLLAGKAIANGLLAGAPTLVCVLFSAAVFARDSLALWLCLPLGLAATYFLAVPAAALWSALFPRAVDLNSIGRGSNAHGAAGLLGLLSFVAAGIPSLLLSFLTARWLARPTLAPLVLLAWCVVAYGICRLALVPLRRLLARRRENLALVV